MRSIPLRKVLAAILTATTILPSSRAATRPPAMEELLFGDIPMVMTASKMAEKVTDAPATVYVVNREEIRARGYSNLKDVFRDLPGMEVIENSFSEWGTEVPVRGVVGNNKIAVLLNGVRVNPPGGENFPFRADFSVRNAKQIEVVYGPGSTLYGQDAISMVVNVITENPGEGRRAEIGFSGGSLGGVQGWATGLRKGSEVDVVAHVQYQKGKLSNPKSVYGDYHNSIFSPLTGVGDKPERWDDGLNGFVRLSNENTAVQVWQRDSSRSSSEGGYAGILYYVNEGVWKDVSTVASVENTLPLSETVDLTSILTHNKYEISPRTRYVFPNGGGGLFLNDYKYGVGVGTTLEEKISFALDPVVVVGGVEAGHYDVKPKATYPNGADRSKAFTDQAGTFDYYTSTNPLSALTSVPRANDLVYSNVGAYLEGTFKPRDTLKFTLGGRVDKNSRFRQTPFSPRAALVFNLTKELTTKYIYTKAFVYPAPYFGFNNFDNGSALNIGNSKLEPEKATSNELNLSWDSAKVFASASVYLNEQENLIIVGDSATSANIIQNTVFLDTAGTSTRILTHSANAGSSRSKGVDLSARLKLGKSSLWSSYSYVDFHKNVLGTVSGLEQTSRHNVRLGVTQSMMDGKLLVTPSALYGSRPVKLAVPASLKKDAGDPFEINLHTVFTVSKKVDLFLDVRNLTNHHYVQRGVLSPTLAEPFRTFAGVRVSL